jgi:hypothetical protein
MTGTTWKTPYAGSAMSILLSIISGLVAIGAGVRLSLSGSSRRKVPEFSCNVLISNQKSVGFRGLNFVNVAM